MKIIEYKETTIDLTGSVSIRLAGSVSIRLADSVSIKYNYVKILAL